MIIIRTPYRISFFGGGSDYPAWYRENGGCVLSTTINKYSFLVLRKLPDIFDYKYRVRYYELEEAQHVDEIKIPVIREAIKYLDYDSGVDITHHGDLPNRTGIGSSSSFTVGLLHGLSALQNRSLTKRELALKAIDLEQNTLKEAVGSQDQVAAAFGGLNRINFNPTSEFIVNPLTINKSTYKELESWVQIFFTSSLRNAHDIAEKKIQNIKGNKIDLKISDEFVNEAEKLLFANNIKDFASLLNAQWELKKKIETSITNSVIDDIYQRGIQAGAVGGKLLGAGGGGFIMFMTPPEKQHLVSNALNLKQAPINFEFLGSQLIYHDYQDQE
jgi:D-glycero-alpha-D-manno-heptose-7-phosphate kinase